MQRTVLAFILVNAIVDFIELLHLLGLFVLQKLEVDL